MRRRFSCALITGASRGIGAEFARALPPHTTLLLSGRDQDALNSINAELATDCRQVHVIPADLTQPTDRDRLVEAAERWHVDLLVNNAGAGEFGPFLGRDIQRHHAAIDLNIDAVVDLSHRLLPGMINRAEENRSRAGLINVSSSAAFAPVPMLAVYAASKAFVLAFTEALTAEVSGEPIDVLAFCPGAVRTEFGENAGYSGGRMPGSMEPERAARAALDALGRKRTLVLDKYGAVPLTAVSISRAAFAQVVSRGLRRFAASAH